MKPPRPLATDPAARRAWARPLFADVTNRPMYGTAEWAELGDDDPRKLAAAIVAAECWASDLDELPERLSRELETHRAAEQHAWNIWRADYRAAHAEAARQMVRSLLDPSMVALGRRLSMTEDERVAEARRPRPTDRHPRPLIESGEHAA